MANGTFPFRFPKTGKKVIEVRLDKAQHIVLAIGQPSWKEKLKPALDSADGDFRVKNVQRSLKEGLPEGERLKVTVPRKRNGQEDVGKEALGRLVFDATLTVWKQAALPGGVEAAIAFFPKAVFFKVVYIHTPPTPPHSSPCPQLTPHNPIRRK